MLLLDVVFTRGTCEKECNLIPVCYDLSQNTLFVTPLKRPAIEKSNFLPSFILNMSTCIIYIKCVRLLGG